MIGIQRCIKAVCAQVSAGVELAKPRDCMRRDAGRRVHRQMKGDQVGSPHHSFVIVESFLRKIQLVHGRSSFAQPGSGGSQAERLMAEVIGRDQNDMEIGQQSGRRDYCLFVIRCECPGKASKIGTILAVS